MAIITHERIGRALDLFRKGLAPFVEWELKSRLGDDWAIEVKELLNDTRLEKGGKDPLGDTTVILAIAGSARATLP